MIVEILCIARVKIVVGENTQQRHGERLLPKINTNKGEKSTFVSKIIQIPQTNLTKQP